MVTAEYQKMDSGLRQRRNTTGIGDLTAVGEHLPSLCLRSVGGTLAADTSPLPDVPSTICG